MSQSTAFLIVITVIFAPFFGWMIYAIVRARRKAARLAREGKPSEPFADAAPEPVPGFLLRRFDPPQRAYLRRQWLGVKTVYKPVAWMSFVLFSAGFMPQFISHNNPALQPTLIWEGYLDTFGILGGIAGVGGLVFALFAISNLGATSPGRFTRTRPFSLRFLYWAHIGPMLTTLCAGLLTGALLSFFLLLISYGPIWQSLPHNASALATLGPCNCPDDVQSLPAALQSSLPRLILSLITTSILAFSLAATFFTQPLSFLRKPGIMLPVAMLLVFGSAMHSLLLPPHIARVFFLYSTHGPPPRYLFAIVPLTLSAVLLLVAERFTKQRDT
jgi:hypothetical protein